MKKGFTLAEVLITLAIIGVVAALTIPALMVSYQKKQYYTAFMKEYNALSKALSMAQVEHGPVNEWKLDDDMSESDFLKTYLGGSLKISKICETAEDCNLSNDDMVHALYVGEEMESSAIFPYGQMVSYIKPIVLEDGSFLMNGGENIHTDDKEVMMMIIDTNGAKKPNTFGRDIFCLAIYKVKNGYILAPWESYDCSGDYCEPKRVVERANTLNSDNYGCSTTSASSGQGCAIRLLLEGKMDY